MSLRGFASLAMIFPALLGLLAVSAESVAAEPNVGTPSRALQVETRGEVPQAASTSPTVRLAGAGYYGFPGRSYYGRYGYRGAGLYYRSNRVYAYGNPYLYRGSYLGYGYTTAYRPYLYSPSIYGGYYGYYRPYWYAPYRYTTPLSLYGVYYAPAFGYGYSPGVAVSYGGCYYW